MRKLWESAREPEFESFRTADFESFEKNNFSGQRWVEGKLLSFRIKSWLMQKDDMISGRSFWTDRIPKWRDHAPATMMGTTVGHSTCEIWGFKPPKGPSCRLGGVFFAKTDMTWAIWFENLAQHMEMLRCPIFFWWRRQTIWRKVSLQRKCLDLLQIEGLIYNDNTDKQPEPERWSEPYSTETKAMRML